MLRHYTEAELRAEIERAIAAAVERAEPVHPAWLTHGICRSHQAGLAEHADGTETLESEHVAFWRFTGYTLTRKLATTCINDLKEQADDANATPQPFLPGFKYLQPQYVIRRDGVDVMVPTGQLTYEECLAKASLYEHNSITLAEHARELRRYAEMVKAQASGL
jgi:hypothetical protein